MSETRKLARFLVSNVVGYSRLTGADEDRILARLRALRSDLIDPTIAVHHGRLVERTGDGAIVEFRSVVDAVNCAIEIQRAMVERNAEVAPDKRIEFRIGIHLGDVVEESDGDLMGEGVNVAARLESIALPGGLYLSRSAFEQVQGKIEAKFVDLGEKSLKNITRPINVYALDVQVTKATEAEVLTRARSSSAKPSIAVLPFQNMSSDPEQEHFADGLSEDIITAVSRIHSLFVIARNSTFTYKGRVVNAKQVGHELNARYILEGSVRKSANRIRVTGQLIDAVSDKHIWAEKYDRALDDIFQIQDDIVRSVVASVELQVGLYEGEIVNRDRIDVWSLLKRSFSNTYKFTIPSLEEGARLAEKAIQLDENSALAYGQLSSALHNLALMRRGATAHREQGLRQSNSIRPMSSANGSWGACARGSPRRTWPSPRFSEQSKLIQTTLSLGEHWVRCLRSTERRRKLLQQARFVLNQTLATQPISFDLHPLLKLTICWEILRLL
jgi:TolB-like protein/class 3 adenylate cyclase